LKFSRSENNQIFQANPAGASCSRRLCNSSTKESIAGDGKAVRESTLGRTAPSFPIFVEQSRERQLYVSFEMNGQKGGGDRWYGHSNGSLLARVRPGRWH
jgi:hypothetical protein